MVDSGTELEPSDMGAVVDVWRAMAELCDPDTLELQATTEELAKAAGIGKARVKGALAALSFCAVTQLAPGRPLHPARYRMNGFPAGFRTKSEPTENRVVALGFIPHGTHGHTCSEEQALEDDGCEAQLERNARYRIRMNLPV